MECIIKKKINESLNVEVNHLLCLQLQSHFNLLKITGFLAVFQPVYYGRDDKVVWKTHPSKWAQWNVKYAETTPDQRASVKCFRWFCFSPKCRRHIALEWNPNCLPVTHRSDTGPGRGDITSADSKQKGTFCECSKQSKHNGWSLRRITQWSQFKKPYGNSLRWNVGKKEKNLT